jgi:hypothetical protein
MRWILAILIVLCVTSVASSQVYERRVCIYPVIEHEHVYTSLVVPTFVFPPVIIQESPPPPAPVWYLSPPPIPYYVVPHYVYAPRVWVYPHVYVNPIFRY